MQIHLLCIISIHSQYYTCSLCDFQIILLSIFLFWTLSSSLASLCPIQALFSCFPRFASFSFGLFSPLLSLYVQFKLCFPASLDLLPSLLDFFFLFYPFMSNSSSFFLFSSSCFLLFWTFFSFPAPLCPIQLVILL